MLVEATVKCARLSNSSTSWSYLPFPFLNLTVSALCVWIYNRNSGGFTVGIETFKADALLCVGVISDSVRRRASRKLLTWHHMKRKARGHIHNRPQHMDTLHRRYTPFRCQRHDIGNQPFGCNLPEFSFSKLGVAKDREDSQSGGHPQLRSQ